MKTIAFIIGVFSTGCAYYEDRAAGAKDVIDEPTKFVTYTIHGDTSCTPEVRGNVEGSGREWGTTSHGHIDYRFVWDFSAETVMQYRESPLILCRPHVVDRGREICGGITGTIIQISTASICNTHASALHELGHLAGIPSVQDRMAVMNDSSLTTRLTASDVRACASVSLCPSLRHRDVTTVTVTIDPSIPRVEPDYPR